MKKDSLMIYIPRRFEKGIRARFDLRRIKKDKRIEIKCNLCDVYKHQEIRCAKCPFRSFENAPYAGCITWMRKIHLKMGFLMSESSILIRDKEQFKKWKKEAAKHIKFI